MKKLLLVTMFAVLVLASCASQRLPALAAQYTELYENVYKEAVEYTPEENSEYIGSYDLFRNNGTTTWHEFANWVSDKEVKDDEHNCVRFISFQSGTFRADENHKWIESETKYGDPCLMLVKK